MAWSVGCRWRLSRRDHPTTPSFFRPERGKASGLITAELSKCPCLGTSEKIRWYPIPGAFCEVSLTRDSRVQKLKPQLLLTRTWAGKKLSGCGLPPSSVRVDRFPKVLWEGDSLTRDRHNPWRASHWFSHLGSVGDTGSHLSAELLPFTWRGAPGASTSQY